MILKLAMNVRFMVMSITHLNMAVNSLCYCKSFCNHIFEHIFICKCFSAFSFIMLMKLLTNNIVLWELHIKYNKKSTVNAKFCPASEISDGGHLAQEKYFRSFWNVVEYYWKMICSRLQGYNSLVLCNNWHLNKT
jgi:hypothetical protein